MKWILSAVVVAAASLAHAASIPTVVGIYGTTLRIYAGHHENPVTGASYGANIQCYSYFEPDGVTVDYVTCFEWINNGYVPGPNCFFWQQVPDPTVPPLIRCDLEDHPVTAFDIRFRDNDSPNSVAWQGPLPTVTKFSMKGSHGEDQVNNAAGGTILTVMPNLLGAKISKKSGTWRLF